ncbi:MAG: ABC transporter permease [Gemmatimonadota bacterium]|jgi:ABC-2 type transport system permease protein|nr:ABC transporter permease [Gemmatimonadota bacterium]
MGKLYAVIRREYWERVKSPWFLAATLLGPLGFAAITILPAVLALRQGTSNKAKSVIVLDATGVGVGDRLRTALAGGLRSTDTSRATVRVMAPADLAAAETTATREVVAGTFAGYLVLDTAVVAGGPVRYAGRNAANSQDMDLVEGAVRQGLLSHRLVAAGLDPLKVQQLSNIRTPFTSEKLDERGRGGSGVGSVVVGYLIAFLLYMMIALYGQTLMRGVLDEKMTRVAEVIIASVKPDTLLAGKVIGVGGVGVTQQLVWIALGWAIVSFRGPILGAFGLPDVPVSLPSVSAGALATYLALYILGFTFYASLFAATGAMVSNQEDIQQASLPVTALLVASIVFMQPILLQPDSTLSRVMTMLPFSAPVLMPLRMATVQVPAWEIAATLVGMALACAVAIWVAARIYRVGLLMYGKRPSFGEVARWVRLAG